MLEQKFNINEIDTCIVMREPKSIRDNLLDNPARKKQTSSGVSLDYLTKGSIFITVKDNNYESPQQGDLGGNKGWIILFGYNSP